MTDTLSQEEFFEELHVQIETIIKEEYRGIEVADVMPDLFKLTKGIPANLEEEMIYEIIEEKGGKPFDPESVEDDYEDDEENDYDY